MAMIEIVDIFIYFIYVDKNLASLHSLSFLMHIFYNCMIVIYYSKEFLYNPKVHEHMHGL